MLSLKQLQLLILLKQYGFSTLYGSRNFIGKPELATLLRLRYISKNNGLISLLKKGKEIVEDTEELIVVGGNLVAKQKVAKMANIAGTLMQNGIPSTDRLPKENENAFIPSNLWRKFRTCIVSTSRFLGVLQYGNRKIVIYHVGDGNFEWQGYGEYSHFFRAYGAYETKADAMLIVCNDGMGPEVAERIIRHSIWKRKTLIKDYGSYENPKPHKYSRAEITVRSDYGVALFCETRDILDTLKAFSQNKNTLSSNWIEEDSENYIRKIDNGHNDLLLYVKAISEANNMHPCWKYIIKILPKYGAVIQNFKTPLRAEEAVE